MKKVKYIITATDKVIVFGGMFSHEDFRNFNPQTKKAILVAVATEKVTL